MGRRGVVSLTVCVLLFGCTSAPTARGEQSSSPLAEAIGYDPMNGIFPKRRFAEVEAECIQSRGFAVAVEVPSPTTVPEDLSLEEILNLQPGDDADEPYADFTSSLSAAERATFDDALFACNSVATAEVYGSADGYPVALTTAVEDMQSRVRSDPRTLKVSGEYSGCMADRGFDGYDSPNAVADDLGEKAQELVDMKNENNNLSASDPRVATMMQFERSILSANSECLERSDYQAVVAEVAVDVQTAYLDEHPDFAQQVLGDPTVPPPNP